MAGTETGVVDPVAAFSPCYGGPFLTLHPLVYANLLKEKLEKEYGSNIKFKKNKWKHGEFRTIKGEVIEKGGVAFSNVVGKFTKEFAKRIPGAKKNRKFWRFNKSIGKI